MCYLVITNFESSFIFIRLTPAVFVLGLIIAFSYRSALTRNETEIANTALNRADARMLELTKLDVLKSQFFTNITHELRTPLTLILGPIKILTKNFSFGKEETAMLKKAEANGERLLELVSSLLDLSKLDVQKLELDRSPIRITSFVRNALSNFESIASQKEIYLTSQYYTNELLQVSSDANKLKIIINNLLANAFKFTKKGCLLYTSPSPRDQRGSRMPSSA